MPTSQKVQIDTYDFGASLTLPTLENPLTGDAITDGTATTCNEQSVDSGVYIADYVGADASHLVPAGTYRLTTAVNGQPLKRWVTFTGVDGEVVYARTERTVELDAASRSAILTQEIVESYPADAAAPTLAQAVMLTLQHLQQKSVSGTTVTIKKLDKSTTAATYTLDSATDPTSITRAT